MVLCVLLRLDLYAVGCGIFSFRLALVFLLLLFSLRYHMFVFVSLYCPLVSTHKFYFFSFDFSFVSFVEISFWWTLLMIPVHSFSPCALPPKMADNSCFQVRRPHLVIRSDWHLQNLINTNTICTLRSKTPPRIVVISSFRSSSSTSTKLPKSNQVKPPSLHRHTPFASTLNTPPSFL